MITEVILAAALTPAPLDPQRQAVVCAEVGFSRSVERRDFEAFLGFLDPEARFVTGGVARGPEEIGQHWAAFFDADGPRIRWRPAIVEVVANGTLAISRGPYLLTTVAEDGGLQQAWGTFSSTWRLNADGQWRVLFDAGGDHGKTPTADEIALLEAAFECP